MQDMCYQREIRKRTQTFIELKKPSEFETQGRTGRAAAKTCKDYRLRGSKISNESSPEFICPYIARQLQLTVQSMSFLMLLWKTIF